MICEQLRMLQFLGHTAATSRSRWWQGELQHRSVWALNYGRLLQTAAGTLENYVICLVGNSKGQVSILMDTTGSKWQAASVL